MKIFFLFIIFLILPDDSNKFLLENINLEIYSSLGYLHFKEPIKEVEKIQIGTDDNGIVIYDQRSKENKKKNPTSVSISFTEIDNLNDRKKKIRKNSLGKTYEVIVQSTTKLEFLYNPKTQEFIKKSVNSKAQGKFIKTDIYSKTDYRNVSKKITDKEKNLIKVNGNSYKYEPYSFGYAIDFRKPVIDRYSVQPSQNNIYGEKKKNFSTKYNVVIKNKKKKNHFFKFGPKYETLIYKSEE